jgi:hypothetical protein
MSPLPCLTRALIGCLLLTVRSAVSAPIPPATSELESTLHLIDQHGAELPRLQMAAEATASRLIAGGKLYLAGDTAWVEEGNGRAGGLRCALLLTNADRVQSGDVVWLGDSNLDSVKTAAVAASLKGHKCLVVYFGSSPPASLPEGALTLDNFAPPHSAGHLALLGNILSLWTETAELAAATARPGRTLFFLQSHSVDGGRQREALYGKTTFHDGIPAMSPVEPGVLARAYLDEIRSGRRQQLAPGSLLVFIGYVAVPLDLWHAVRNSGATAAWIVSPLPGEVGFRQFGDTVIAQPWDLGDAYVSVPGYDIRILPPSGVIQLLIFDLLIANAESRNS